MSRQYMVSSGNLPRQGANELSDFLEACPWPEAAAVSMVETSEQADLWRIEAIYETEPAGIDLSAAFERAGLAPPDLVIAPVPETDWVRKSLEGLAPVRAGRLFVHGAHDRLACPSGSIGIEIDAGLAFGTGHHNTTRGCLLALQRILRSRTPVNCLDLGCGSGVLAIAACKLTGIYAIASDIDREAVQVARDNARLNATGHLVRCVTAAGLDHPAISAHAPYDLILANILARPLVALAPAISRALSKTGSLVLSGLTQDQIRMVRAAYLAQGLSVFETLLQDNWATLTLTRKQRGAA